MKKLFGFSLSLFIFVIFYSCDDIIEKNTPENVFEVFWRTMDENYVYFEEKGIDWDSIYNIYSLQAKNAVNDDDLRRIFREIIHSFTDRNIILFTDKEWIFSWTPYDDDNKEDTVYLPYAWQLLEGFDVKQDEQHFYCSENKEKHITYFHPYVRWGEQNINTIKRGIFLDSLDCVNGLIIDLTSNAAGDVMNFISAFFTGEKIVYYIQDKSGKGHNDFGNKVPLTLQGDGYVADSVPIVILTNRNTYNGCNWIIYALADLRNHCTVIGTPTGGGGGSTRSVFLPNGWKFEFPDAKLFSSSGRNMEYEFKPDIYAEGDDIYQVAIEFLDSLRTAKQ